jgi:SRSO17 transposase
VVILDDLSATYLHARAEGSQKSITEIIGEMVREKIAAGVEMVHAGK